MFPKTERDNDIIKRSRIVDFIPPQRHDGAHSYIWFSQTDPMTGKLKRKKYMLDRFRPGRERDIAANRIIANIYNQVASCLLKNRWDARHFTQEFNKVREELRFPKHYMFYSLKDSRLRDISNAVGVEVAQKQARHSSIQTTNMYLQGKSMKVYDVLADFEELMRSDT